MTRHRIGDGRCEHCDEDGPLYTTSRAHAAICGPCERDLAREYSYTGDRGGWSIRREGDDWVVETWSRVTGSPAHATYALPCTTGRLPGDLDANEAAAISYAAVHSERGRPIRIGPAVS